MPRVKRIQNLGHDSMFSSTKFRWRMGKSVYTNFEPHQPHRNGLHFKRFFPPRLDKCYSWMMVKFPLPLQLDGSWNVKT